MSEPIRKRIQSIRDRLSMERTKSVGREVMADLKRDDVPGLGAEIAYHAIFAIPPMIILVVTIAAAINQFTGFDVAGKLIQTIEERAPDEIRELLITLVNNAIANVSGGLASLGVLIALVIAIWSGSNGIGALIKAFNRAYGVEESRSWPKLKSLSVGLTILVAVLVNAAFFMLVFGSQMGSWAEKRFDLGNSVTTAFEYARTPLAFVFVVFVLALLYWAGPNVNQTFRWLSPGSIVATILWAVAAFGFQIYLRFSDPGSAYGALGSIVVLMFFLYISGIICVIGAEINAILGVRFDPETVEDLAEHPSKLTDPDDRPEAERRAASLEQDEHGKPTAPKTSGRRKRGAKTPTAPEPQTASDPVAEPTSRRVGQIIGALAFVAVTVGGVLRRRGREA